MLATQYIHRFQWKIARIRGTSIPRWYFYYCYGFAQWHSWQPNMRKPFITSYFRLTTLKQKVCIEISQLSGTFTSNLTISHFLAYSLPDIYYGQQIQLGLQGPFLDTNDTTNQVSLRLMSGPRAVDVFSKQYLSNPNSFIKDFFPFCIDDWIRMEHNDRTTRPGWLHNIENIPSYVQYRSRYL